MSQAIEVNSIVEGRVVRIKPFGAVIQLPDKSSGLVHISHISPKYVQDVNDFLSVGDSVYVKVLSVDAESGKIALSIKDAAQPEVVSAPKPDNRNYENIQHSATASFEDKFKDWLKSSNEKQAGLNKRNKRR